MESTEDRIVKEIEAHRQVKEQVKAIKSKIAKPKPAPAPKPKTQVKPVVQKKPETKPPARAPLQPRPVNITQYEKRKYVVKKILLDENANENKKPKRDFAKEREVREKLLHGPVIQILAYNFSLLVFLLFNHQNSRFRNLQL